MIIQAMEGSIILRERRRGIFPIADLDGVIAEYFQSTQISKASAWGFLATEEPIKKVHSPFIVLQNKEH